MVDVTAIASRPRKGHPAWGKKDESHLCEDSSLVALCMGRSPPPFAWSGRVEVPWTASKAAYVTGEVVYFVVITVLLPHARSLFNLFARGIPYNR